jgi:hypothetical protein
MKAGLPDFSWYNIPNRGKIYHMITKLSNAHKIYPTGVKYSKRPENIQTFSISRSSKVYPNWYFCLKRNHLAILNERGFCLEEGGNYEIQLPFNFMPVFLIRVKFPL